jgi:hypothetical protein
MPADQQQAPDRAEADARQAWIYASNCRLYEDDPGPRQLNIGSQHEPRWVSRAYAWRDAYAHYLLVDLDADHHRILAAARAARQDLAKTRWPAFWISVARTRMQGGAPLRARAADTAKAFSPREIYPLRKVYKVAVVLCDLAAQLVVDADAVDDDRARRRLLAGAKNTGKIIALESLIPDIAEDSTIDLIEELNRIDTDTSPTQD